MACIARAAAAIGVYELKTMKFKWECPDCRQGGAYRFSDITGTIFENTNVDLRQWYRVIHLMLTSKKGMSARQIHRYMGFGSYKTAWYMCHRIRAALQDKEFREAYVVSSRSMRPSWAGKPTTSMGSAAVVAVAAPAPARRQSLARSAAKAMSSPASSRTWRRHSHTVRAPVRLREGQPSRHRRMRPVIAICKKVYPHKVVKHTAGEYVVGRRSHEHD